MPCPFRTTLHLCILFLSSFVSHSQKLISLTPLETEIRDRKFFISEIVDARSEKKIIGIILNGSRHIAETTEFKDGFEPEMQKFLTLFLQPAASRTPLVMRILKLTVTEKATVTGETGAVELVIEFYQKTNEGLVLLKGTGSNFTKSGSSATRLHDDGISSTFIDCFKQLNNHLIVNTSFLSGKAIDRQELSKTPEILQVYDFPILRDSTLKKGIYKNFIEFRDNNPSLGHDIRKIMMGTEAQNLGNVWGYSDGENIFILSGGHSHELTNEENIFWFYASEIQQVKSKVTGESLLLTFFTGDFTMESSINTKLVKYAINLGNGDLLPLD